MKHGAIETLGACIIEFLDICSCKIDMYEHRILPSVPEMNLPLFKMVSIAPCRDLPSELLALF